MEQGGFGAGGIAGNRLRARHHLGSGLERQAANGIVIGADHDASHALAGLRRLDAAQHQWAAADRLQILARDPLRSPPCGNQRQSSG